MQNNERIWNNNTAEDEIQRNGLEYGTAVNTDRALPDVRTGLKPVQKRILFDMNDMKWLSNKPHIKCARPVGDTMGRFHPHGDSSIYGALVRLTQDWVMRYPLIDGHGNFGNILGDGEAAMRYTECRLTKLAEEGLLTNLNKDVVDFILNYDEKEKEPITLPAIFPNILCNPTTGIGWAMASSWAPHNLTEVGNAIKQYLAGEEPMLPGPDFPTGGLIINKNDIPAIMKTGHGTVKIRGKYNIEKQNIVFYEIPYGQTIEGLMQNIAKACEEGKVEGVNSIKNETSKKIRLVIECDKGVNPEGVVQQLFAKTNLQSNFSYNQVALNGKVPDEFNLKDTIIIYVEHNIECIVREAQFDKKKAEDRLHIVEGLIKALEDIDNIIALIKKSNSASDAKVALIEKYKFTEPQVKAILDMKLSRLAKLEKVELEEEAAELKKTIEELNALISSDSKQKEELVKRLDKIVAKYGDERRTELAQIDVPKTKAEKEKVEIVPEDVVVVVTKDGYVKRVPVKSFKTQSRGGKGVKTTDDAMKIMKTNTVDMLMLFSTKGKMYKISVNKIPEGTNVTKGTSLANFIKTENNEQILAATCLHSSSLPKYIIFITSSGMIKKSLLSEYMGTRGNSTGIIALTLKENDSVKTVLFQDNEDILLATKNGKGLRIKTDLIAPIGRTSRGVIAMRLKEGDEILDALSVHKESDNLAVVCENGMGKCIELSEIPVQTRASVGVDLSKNPLAGIAMVDLNNNLIIHTKSSSICISVKDIPVFKRAAEGNILSKNTPVISIGKI